MNKVSLDFLFKPKSVAVVGASSNPRKIGGRVLNYLKTGGYAGNLYAVNPNYSELNGIPCYPSLENIPEKLDQAILVLPAKDVIEQLEHARIAKPRCIAIIGGGFAEVGNEGIRAQQQIRQFVEETGIRVMGPNCLGIMNVPEQFVSIWATIFEARGIPAGSRIGYAGQSGAVGAYSLAQLMRKGYGLNVLASTGNEVDISAGECVEYLAYDSNIDVILLYLEGCRDAKSLIGGLGAAASQNKPVIVIKVGKSSQGASASASHTASIVGSDDAYGAIFEKYGAIRVEDVEEAVDLAATYIGGKLPPSDRVGIATISGGLGVLLTDKFIEMGLEVPNFQAETINRAKELVPMAGVSNPLDMTAIGADNPDIMKEMLANIAEDENVDAVVVHMQYNMLSKIRLDRMVEVFAEIKTNSKKPFFLCGLTDLEGEAKLVAANINYFPDTYRCAKTVFNAVKLNKVMSEHRNQRQLPDVASEFARAKEQAVGLIAATKNAGYLNEYDSMNLIKLFGIPTADAHVAQTQDEAVLAASQLGYPVVIKILSADILHKTDANAVKTGLNSEGEVRQAFNQVIDNAMAYKPEAKIAGVLVAKMIADKNAREIILGMIQDEVFGPVITVGSGGIEVELFKDKAVAIPPLSVEDSSKILLRLKSSKILRGFRGSAPVDFDALLQAISAFSSMAVLLKEHVSEMEINPLTVLTNGSGVVALDALVRINSN